MFDKVYPTSAIFNTDYTYIIVTSNKNKNVCISLKYYKISTRAINKDESDFKI